MDNEVILLEKRLEKLPYGAMRELLVPSAETAVMEAFEANTVSLPFTVDRQENDFRAEVLAETERGNGQ